VLPLAGKGVKLSTRWRSGTKWLASQKEAFQDIIYSIIRRASLFLYKEDGIVYARVMNFGKKN
jgi:hypothetical protein